MKLTVFGALGIASVIAFRNALAIWTRRDPPADVHRPALEPAMGPATRHTGIAEA
jgi:hypothetical protein